MTSRAAWASDVRTRLIADFRGWKDHEALGFERCCHMIEVGDRAEHLAAWTAATRGEAVDWDALFEGYRAAVDWPTCNFWRELADYYPRSKVILTTRDPERWYESV